MKKIISLTLPQAELFLAIVILIALLSSCQEKALFETLPPEKTGITFSNTITESDSFNILTYEYVYNGGGVGLADVNQDGLLDIFFSGNMVDNRLYLNQGGFRFRDITESAGVAGRERWSTGVSVVDINQDGLPDFYVTASTYEPAGRRANQLFVNQGPDAYGVPVFHELAVEYGLADTSHTTVSAFFDYDNDGDLDVYLAINEMDQTRQPNSFRDKVEDGSSRRTDKLFRNDGPGPAGHPVYSDVSAEAGIRLEGFSLGLNIVDINRDGWKDIYVTNDFITNDLLYVNNGDGTFTNKASEYFKHTSHSAMGNDVADINNDGLADLVSVDMLPEDNFRRKTMMTPNNYTNTINNLRYGYDFQYVRNTLQLNRGALPGGQDPVFSEVAMLAGIHATDWSWTPSVADFDNDGLRDIIITNGFPKDITDHDFIDYRTEVQRIAPVHIMLKEIPSVKLVNVAFKNEGNLQFSKVNDAWGFDIPSFSNGAAYGDLDNDGDLDLVVNNIDDPAFVHRNTLSDKDPDAAHWLMVEFSGPEGNAGGLGARVEIELRNGEILVSEHTPYRGYLSSVDPRMHFGLGEIDKVKSLRVIWPDGKTQRMEEVQADQVVRAIYAEARKAEPVVVSQKSPFFEPDTGILRGQVIHREVDFIDFNVQPLLPHKLSQYGPGLAVADINGDGLTDMYLGGSRERTGTFFLQQSDGSFRQEQRIIPDDLDPEPEELGVLFFDADGDGDDDLYMVGGGYEWPEGNPALQDRIFLNENGRFHLAEDALPDMTFSGGCARAADFDNDGDLDLFVAGRVVPGEYPKPVSSVLLRNDSKDGALHFSTADDAMAGLLTDLGMVCDALWTDFDNDGWQDLFLVGEWMAPTLLRNVEGKLMNATSDAGLNAFPGMWTSLVAGDFDRDGDMDYVAGNLGFNTLHKVEPGHPIRVYGADFDGNGGFDAVPSLYLPVSHDNPELREFPYFNRLDMQKQIIAMKRDYMLHADFARADMEQLFPEENRADALILEASDMASSYLENTGDGRFRVKALPIEAQFAPVYGMLAEDYDGDGHLDLLLVGNDFGTEVATGRYDALNGLLLRGNGKGGFEPSSHAASGFYVPGDAKSLVSLPLVNGSEVIVAGQNRGPLRAFRKTRPRGRFLQAGTLEYAAILHYRDGRARRVEFPYGSSFLSQTSRFVFVDDTVVDVQFLGPGDEERRVDPQLATQ